MKQEIIIIVIIRYSAFFERIIALTSNIEGKGKKDNAGTSKRPLPKILLGREQVSGSGSNGASITISEIHVQEEREPNELYSPLKAKGAREGSR